MTNLFAAIIITLTTNVVESDNHRGCDVCAGIRQSSLAFHVCVNMTNWNSSGTYVPATEKYRTTTCTEVATCKFERDGRPWVLSDERTVWKTIQTFKKKDEWVPDGPPKEVYLFGQIMGTNGCQTNPCVWPTNFNKIFGVQKVWPLTSHAIPSDAEIWLMNHQAELDRIKAQVDRDVEIMKQREKEGK